MISASRDTCDLNNLTNSPTISFEMPSSWCEVREVSTSYSKSTLSKVESLKSAFEKSASILDSLC
jgi:hypothetical protein